MTIQPDSAERRLNMAFEVSIRMTHLKDRFFIPPEIHFGIIHKILEYNYAMEINDDDFIELMKSATSKYMKYNIGSVSLSSVDFFEFDDNEVREEYLQLLEYIDNGIGDGGKYGTFIEMNETVNIVMTEKKFNSMKIFNKDFYEELHDVVENFKGVVYSHTDNHNNQFKIIRFYDTIINMKYNVENAAVITRNEIITKLKDECEMILL